MNNDEYRIVTHCLELCDLFPRRLVQEEVDFITQVKHEVRMNGIMTRLRTGVFTRIVEINKKLKER